MAKIKPIRQGILGQQLLGRDRIAETVILRLERNDGYSVTLFPPGSYVAGRSPNSPNYNYGRIPAGVQEAYANQDGLGNIFRLPTNITHETAFPRAFLLYPTPPIRISGAILEIGGYANANPLGEFPLLYGILPDATLLEPLIPRNVGFDLAYVAPPSFATFFNSSGPKDVLILGGELPMDYIKYVRIRFLRNF